MLTSGLVENHCLVDSVCQPVIQPQRQLHSKCALRISLGKKDSEITSEMNSRQDLDCSAKMYYDLCSQTCFCLDT